MVIKSKKSLSSLSENSLHAFDCELYGFEKIENLLINLWQQNKFYHALLIDGQKGSGKASFAVKLAIQILNNENYSSLNPDLLIISKEEAKKDITIEQIRKIAVFINHTSAIAKHKFIIIDSADELNKSASNALLKVLEEPLNNNFLILVSHNLHKVLPTIKSRCQTIKINNFTLDTFKKILDKKAARKINNQQELEFIASISEYSPAKALILMEVADNIYQNFLTSILNRKIDQKLLKIFVEKSDTKSLKNISNEEILSQVVYFFFKRVTFFLYKQNINLYALEEQLFETLHPYYKNNLNRIFAMFSKVNELLNQAQTLNLDKKLTFINIHNLITKLFK